MQVRICITYFVPKNIYTSNWLNLQISSLPRNDQGLVPYDELLRQINWRDHAVPPIQQTQSRPDEAWQGNPPGSLLQTVNINALQQDLQGGRSGGMC